MLLPASVVVRATLPFLAALFPLTSTSAVTQILPFELLTYLFVGTKPHTTNCTTYCDVTLVPLHNWLAHVTAGCADHLHSPPLHEHRCEPHDRSAAAGAGESAGGRGGQVACAPPTAIGSLISGGAGRERQRASLSGRQR